MFLHAHRPETALKNQEMELIRNKERLQFFKVSSACAAAEATYMATVLYSETSWLLVCCFSTVVFESI